MQAGEDDFSDDNEYDYLGRLNIEYAMTIEDWYKTPIYNILTRDMDVQKALFKYCNKATLNKLAGDLRERKEFEERTEIRAKRDHAEKRQKNPFLAKDSDTSDDGNEEPIEDRVVKM